MWWDRDGLRGGGVGFRLKVLRWDGLMKELQRCEFMSRLVSPSWADPRQCRHRIWLKPSDSQETRVGARRLTALPRETKPGATRGPAGGICGGHHACSEYLFPCPVSLIRFGGAIFEWQENGCGETLYASRASVFHWRSPVVSGADPALRRDLAAAQWFRRPRL